MNKARIDSNQIKLFTLPQPHSCSYLEGRLANSVFLDPRTKPNNEEYSALTQIGFRRSGSHYYRPHCPGCDACVSCRVLCRDFEPNKRQRRVERRNQDIHLRTVPVTDKPEYFDLYCRYIASRHQDGDMYPASREQFESFILDAPQGSFIIEHWVDSRLVAASLTDEVDDGWSAIYTFYDPIESKRSLGVWSVISQIEQVKALGKAHLYLGYWIDGCRKMNYKREYQPQEHFNGYQWEASPPIQPDP